MKKYLLFLTLFSGCSSCYAVFPTEWNKAIELCKEHKGIEYYVPVFAGKMYEFGQVTYSFGEVRCNDGVVITDTKRFFETK